MRQRPIRVLVGYDGSPAASTALDAGSLLLPGAHAVVAHLWAPPFTSPELRRRLWTGSRDVDAFTEAVEREGDREAHRLADVGSTLARAAGWEAEQITRRSYGGEGLQLAQIADEADVDVVLVGSRGLRGGRALLGSVSDMLVHYSSRPVLVVPHPLLTDEYAALANGPALVGWDGSAGAALAWRRARELFPGRELIAAVVGRDGTASTVPTPPSDAGLEPAAAALPRDTRGGRARRVAGALTAQARTLGAAAVVVGSRGRSAAQEILLGTVAKATLHRAPLPVLVVPPADHPDGERPA
ncbi:universal stress protein [Dactylosporangium roseum]|uniref:Universal stress protein n=1 Tax=Dactylosporangium roseum TaxID=47989 RepID=A0ABY5YWZ9_9ACTN|nr:universal stress protein [Dactylosporangium roseum]UWZ34269.1 universal stress protein [Dactylosporangium roseum]